MFSEITPWLSPRLTPSLIGVLTGLGHSMKYSRGDVIYSSPGLFEKLMFVRSGFVVKALLDPIREEPLLLSLAGSGALCGSYENLYVRDRMLRRHWCMTTTEVLVVNQELLLKVADQMPEWQRELSGYSSASVLCDRMGVYLNHSGSIEQRLGALLIQMLETKVDSRARLETKGVQWIELWFIPGLTSCAALIGCSPKQVHDVIRLWISRGAVRLKNKKLWLKRQVFDEYRSWLQLYVLQQS